MDSGDFRLIDRTIIEHLREYHDRSPYLRGTVASLGYPQIGIPYDRAERSAGRSKFNFIKLLALSIDGVCSQSTKPLQFITVFGFGLSAVAGILIIIYLSFFLYGADREFAWIHHDRSFGIGLDRYQRGIRRASRRIYRSDLRNSSRRTDCHHRGSHRGRTG